MSRTIKLGVVACLLAIAILLFDLSLPLGVAGGVPYVALVMLGLWFPRRQQTLYLAIAGTTLTLVGYHLSPPGGVPWIVLSNRALAIFAIWVTAALIYKYSAVAADRLKLSRAVEQSPIAIVITDSDGAIEYANARLLETSGFSIEDITGKTSRVFKSGETQRDTYKELWQTIRSGRKWRGELINKTKDGRAYLEDVTIFPVFNQDGNVMNFVSFKEDITERKRAESELIATRERAEIANRTKSKFLANMSHEFLTPLNAILGFSETMTLQVYGPLGNDKYLEYARDIQGSGLYLKSMIEDILNLSKIESGRKTLHDENINIEALLQTCLVMVAGQAKSKGVTIEDLNEDELPWVKADDQKIKQVVLNLLTNAIKFTPKGGKVAMKCYKNRDGECVIDVSDTGIGIAEKDHELVFSPFDQVENELTRTQKGWGLGLPISRHLMEMHGGTLELDSTLGAGTTARATLPAHRVATSGAPPYIS